MLTLIFYLDLLYDRAAHITVANHPQALVTIESDRQAVITVANHPQALVTIESG